LPAGKSGLKMSLSNPINTDLISIPPKSWNPRLALTRLAWFVVLTSIFALAYNQAPLYTSNQNQYFLHGYAQAEVGNLKEDWLANTADPTPVFSFLVAATLRVFHSEAPFFIYYALLMGVYFWSLFGIADHLFHIRSSKAKTGLFIAAIILLHSAILRFVVQRYLGGDWPYLFEGGVAGQRLLGTIFQPSSFGVFLVLSIYLFLKDKRVLGVLSAALAATFHPTYLLSAGTLTLAYLIDTWRSEKKLWPVLRLGLLALAAVAPILIYTFINFWGSNPEIDAIARSLLVNVRIPPHAIVSEWFNATVVVKLALVGAGLFLARRSKLFWILLISLCLALGLTLVQVFTNNDSLALIFPWRLSTWLVPIAVALIVGELVILVFSRTTPALEKGVGTAGLVLVALAMASGIFRTYLVNNQWSALPYRPVEAYVRAHLQPGQVILTPSNLYDFRLETGAAIYIDFLSIPYQSADVIEWDRRFRQETYFYQRAECIRLIGFHKEGVTQVVLPYDFPVDCPQLIEIYQDSAYTLYNISP
jgi:hypothetical protein